VPEWYFLPFYAILRALPDKTGGVIAMACSLLVLFLLPITFGGPVITVVPDDISYRGSSRGGTTMWDPYLIL
jgi:quinol-cytochrome oxidoreductase complex cytochrome b subunit